MSIFHPPVVRIADHCTFLSRLLHALAYQEPASVRRGDESYGWLHPADWLDLAASVIKVEVVTAQGDTSLMYCESAMDYENDRSKLLSQLTTSLTVFSFAWGAFESVAKIMDPPSIPKTDRKDGNDSLAARVAYAIRTVSADGVYHCALANIRHRMASLSEYSDCLPAGLGPVTEADAGEGIDLVRRIRNKFAHGAAVLPQRDDWNGKDSLDNQLVRFSCRMVLLTIQMMLRVHFAGRSFEIDDYDPCSDSDEGQEIHSRLESLHIVCETEDDETASTDPEAAGSESGRADQSTETA